MGYFAVAVEDVVGQARGIWVLTLDKSIMCLVTDVMTQAISFVVDKGGRKWFCIAFYASSVPTIRVFLWEHLK